MLRRSFIAGAAALPVLHAVPSLGAERAERVFRILRDGDDIGSHSLSAVRVEDRFEVDISIRIAVRFLGFTAYRYEMDNREVWRGQRIVSIDSTVNDDGTKDRCRIRADGDTLRIEGSRFSGTAQRDSVTTSYYANPFLSRLPWISTQSGQPLKIAIAPVSGRPRWHAVTGDLDTTLGYDERGEWVGCEFDAGGERAIYKIERVTGRLGALWAA